MKALFKNIFFNYFIRVILFLSTVIGGCRSGKIPESAYINNDSTSVYSTHPSRPFKYGYAYSKEMCELYFKDVVEEYGIKKGDVIADVGAASGWVEGALSVFTDSVTYYIQDTNTVFLNTDQFNKVIDHYNKVRTTPQTNTFHFIIGTKNKTNLPDSTFDKIIIHNSYHEFPNSYTIMNDLYYKLKPGGKIIIHESFSNDYKKIRHKGCNTRAYTASQVVRWLKLSDLHLTKMNYPENSLTNYLTFERSDSLTIAFLKKRNTVRKYSDELDHLNEEKIYNDSMSVIRIAEYLKDNMSSIQTVYPTIEGYFTALGYQLTVEKNFTAAFHILNAGILLYPQSALTYNELGETYMKTQQYDLAILNFNKSLEINPGNENAKNQVQKIKEEQAKSVNTGK